MNLIEFKESGLLELYALNACSPEEKLLVEKNLVLYPELSVELDEINAALENYSEIYSEIPPIGLDQKIKKQLVFKPELKVSPNVTIKEANKNNLNFYRVSLAASLLAVLGLSILLFFTQNRLKETENQLAILNQEKVLLSENVNRTSLELTNLSQSFKKISTDDFIQVKLTGTEKFPNAQMKVFWNKASKETFISLVQIPNLPLGKQFQLWALVDGKPINAGVFDSLQGILILSDIATTQADLFAVTIEDKGGSVSPTLSEMVVAGKVIGS